MPLFYKSSNNVTTPNYGVSAYNTSRPFPTNTNCEQNEYELKNWEMFQMYCMSRSSDVVSYMKMELGYYRVEFNNGEVAYYNPHAVETESIRYRTPEQMDMNKPENFLREFSYRVRYLMNKKRINQKELASQLGMSQSSVSYYINGRKIPSVLVVNQLAKALGVSIQFLTQF